jgi:hypothetical protein
MRDEAGKRRASGLEGTGTIAAHLDPSHEKGGSWMSGGEIRIYVPNITLVLSRMPSSPTAWLP